MENSAPRILLLSADEATRATFRELLHPQWTPLETLSVAEAISLVSSHSFDMLFLDVETPAELDEVLAATHGGITAPVVLAIAPRDQGEAILEHVESGAVYRFVLKPFPAGQARLAVDAALRRYSDGVDAADMLPPADNASPKPNRSVLLAGGAAAALVIATSTYYLVASGNKTGDSGTMPTDSITAGTIDRTARIASHSDRAPAGEPVQISPQELTLAVSTFAPDASPQSAAQADISSVTADGAVTADTITPGDATADSLAQIAQASIDVGPEQGSEPAAIQSAQAFDQPVDAQPSSPQPFVATPAERPGQQTAINTESTDDALARRKAATPAPADGAPEPVTFPPADNAPATVSNFAPAETTLSRDPAPVSVGTNAMKDPSVGSVVEPVSADNSGRQQSQPPVDPQFSQNRNVPGTDKVVALPNGSSAVAAGNDIANPAPSGISDSAGMQAPVSLAAGVPASVEDFEADARAILNDPQVTRLNADTLMAAANPFPDAGNAGSAAVPDLVNDDVPAVAQDSDETVLVRSVYVAPEYPKKALQRETQGWVLVSFLVGPDGVPQNVVVEDSHPTRLFERAATRAVRQWRYEPPMENGEVVFRRQTVQIEFSLD